MTILYALLVFVTMLLATIAILYNLILYLLKQNNTGAYHTYKPRDVNICTFYGILVGLLLKIASME